MFSANYTQFNHLYTIIVLRKIHSSLSMGYVYIFRYAQCASMPHFSILGFVHVFAYIWKGAEYMPSNRSKWCDRETKMLFTYMLSWAFLLCIISSHSVLEIIQHPNMWLAASTVIKSGRRRHTLIGILHRQNGANLHPYIYTHTHTNTNTLAFFFEALDYSNTLRHFYSFFILFCSLVSFSFSHQQQH